MAVPVTTKSGILPPLSVGEDGTNGVPGEVNPYELPSEASGPVVVVGLSDPTHPDPQEGESPTKLR